MNKRPLESAVGLIQRFEWGRKGVFALERKSSKRSEIKKNAAGVVLVNTFTPKRGKLEEFVQVQAAEAKRLIDTISIPGLRGNRLLQSIDSNSAIGLALFDSIADHKKWLATNDFSDHLNRITHLLERAEPRYYRVIFQSGQV